MTEQTQSQQANHMHHSSVEPLPLTFNEENHLKTLNPYCNVQILLIPYQIVEQETKSSPRQDNHIQFQHQDEAQSNLSLRDTWTKIQNKGLWSVDTVRNHSDDLEGILILEVNFLDSQTKALNRQEQSLNDFDLSFTSLFESQYGQEYISYSNIVDSIGADSSLLNERVLATSCSSSQYYDPIYKFCKFCSSECSTCKYNTTAKGPLCLFCASGYSFNESFATCGKSCSAGSYYNYQTKFCSFCPNSASTCYQDPKTYSAVATSCPSGRVLNNGVCERSCTSLQYYDPTWDSCNSCSSQCATCAYDKASSSSYCLTCPSGRVLKNNICQKNCSSLQYYDSLWDYCYACPLSCDTCDYNPKTMQPFCLTCPVGSYYNSKTLDCVTCADNQMFNNKTNICQSCPANSATCHYDYKKAAGVSDTCVANYSLNLNTKTCTYCTLDNCTFCTSASVKGKQVCLQCNKGFVVSKGVCVPDPTICPDQQFYHLKEKKCKSCPEQCDLCDYNKTSGQPYCLSCNYSQGFYMNNDGVCQKDCASGFFFDYKNSMCSPCMTGCESCHQNQTTTLQQCDACTSPYIVQDGICIEQCPSYQYFDFGYFNCQDCPTDCNACSYNSSIFEVQCDQCPSGMQWDYEMSTCSPVCSTQEGPSYYDYDQQQCQLCPLGCDDCYYDSTLASVNCKKCATGFNLKAGSCIPSSCEAGQYVDPLLKACQYCPTGCKNCAFDSKTYKMYCTTCQVGYTLTTGKCKATTCASTLYFNVTAKKCIACPSKCTSCFWDSTQSKSLCSACASGFYLQDGSCLQASAKCTANQFYDLQSTSCKPCVTGCSSCQPGNGNAYGNNNNNNDDDDDITRQNWSWIDFFSFYYTETVVYTSDTLNVIQIQKKWTSQTSDSSASSNSTDDKKNKDLKAMKKIFAIPQDSTPASSTQITPTTPSDSDIFANSYSVCSACQSGYLLNNGTCYKSVACPTGQFFDPISQQCQYCPAGCTTCSSLTKCTACKSNYFQLGDFCVYYCINIATSSQGNYTFGCNAQCTAGLFMNNQGKCQACLKNCANCYDNSTCQTCKTGYFLTANQSCMNCPTGSVYDAPSQTCQQSNYCDIGSYYNTDLKRCLYCIPGCDSCKNNKSCTQCNNQSLLLSTGVCAQRCYGADLWDPVNKVCSSTCLKNQYYDQQSGSCMNCSDNCNYCKDGSSCAECRDSYFVVNGFCQYFNTTCQQPNQYFDRSALQCSNCSVGCAKCRDSVTCGVCEIGYMMNSTTITCDALCPKETTYWNVTTQNCQPKVPCSLGQFWDLTDQECYSCLDNCDQCKTNATCNKCSPTFFLYNGRCFEGCNSSAFFNTTTLTCDACSDSCVNCTNSFQCLACKDNLEFVPSTKTCKQCNWDQFWNSTNRLCKDKCNSTQYYSTDGNCYPCSQGCSKCNNQTCLTCQTPRYNLNTTDGTCFDVCLQNSTNWSDYFKICEPLSCPAGFFYANGTCNNTCPFNCTTCTSPTQCQSCLTPQYQIKTVTIQNSAGISTISYCPDSCLETSTIWVPGHKQCETQINCTNATQYYNPDLNQCFNCPQNCTSCNATSCIGCLPHFTLSTVKATLGSCVDVCPLNQTIWVEAHNQCEKKPTCSSSQYYDNVENLCVNCTPGCKSCKSAQCDICNFHFNLTTDGFCVDVCPMNQTIWVPFRNRCEVQANCSMGTFYNETSNLCINCTQNCSACNATQCFACSYHFYLDGGKCYDQCLVNQTIWVDAHNQCETKANCTPNQFYDKVENTCRDCPENCTSCSSNTTCLTCIPHFKVSTTSPALCVDVCTLNSTRWVVPRNMCEKKATCTASQAYNEFNNNCSSCPQNCTTCTQDQCLTCIPHFEISNGTCIDSCSLNQTMFVPLKNQCEIQKFCEINQFYNPQANNCTNCSMNCTSCNSSSCITCIPHFTVNANTKGACVDICSLNNTIWVEGRNSCDTRLTCASNQFYDPFQNTCNNCSQNCAKCTNVTQCLNCYYHFFWDNNTNSCQDECPRNQTVWVPTVSRCNPRKNCSLGQFVNETSNECKNCSEGCNNCSATQCFSCNNHFFLNNSLQCQDICPLNGSFWVPPHNQCEFKMNCSSNQFYNTSDNTCRDCPMNCSTCSNTSKCLTCDYHFSLSTTNPGTCVDVCSLNKTMWVPSKNMCQVKTNCSSTQSYNPDINDCCPQNCSTCSNTSCLTCQYHFYLTQQGQCLDACSFNQTTWIPAKNQCEVLINNCSVGQFYNATLNTCLNCSENCVNCTNPFSCLQCRNDHFQLASSTNQTCIDSCSVNKTIWVPFFGQCQARPNCTIGTFYNETMNQCIPCLPGCSNCTNTINCLACDPQNNLTSNGSCINKCPFLSFFNTSTNACNNCSSTCGNCLNKTFCLTCNSTQFIASPKGDCVDICSMNDTLWNNTSKLCYPKPRFVIQVSNPNVMKCGGVNISVKLLDGFPQNFTNNTIWNVGLVGSTNVALLQNITSQALLADNELSLFIPGDVTKWVTVATDLNITVIVQNIQGVTAQNFTKISLLTNMFTQIANYSSNYTNVLATAGLQLYPAFQYPECQSTLAPIPTTVKINCALFNSSDMFVSNLTGCSIGANVLNANSMYTVRFNYNASQFQPPIMGQFIVVTAPGTNLALTQSSDALNGQLTVNVNHTITCTPPSTFTAALTYTWSVFSNGTGFIPLNGSSGALAQGNKLIIIANTLTTGIFNVTCNASNPANSGSIKNVYSRTMTTTNLVKKSATNFMESDEEDGLKSFQTRVAILMVVVTVFIVLIALGLYKVIQYLRRRKEMKPELTIIPSKSVDNTMCDGQMHDSEVMSPERKISPFQSPDRLKKGLREEDSSNNQTENSYIEDHTTAKVFDVTDRSYQ